MTPEDIRKMRVKNLKQYVDPLHFVKTILGEKVTYLKDVEDLTDDDLSLVWEQKCTYGIERQNILNQLDRLIEDAYAKGKNYRGEELGRLARAIERET
jgi:hypothetical protein